MEISFDKLLSIAKKNLLFMIAAGLVCFGITYAYMTFAVAPQYYSSVKFRISITEQNDITSYYATVRTDRDLVPTYIAMLDSNDFYKQVQSELPEDLRDKYSYGSIKGGISMAAVNETEILRLTFSCGTPEDAERIVATVYDCIEPRIASITKESYVYLVESPTRAATSGTKTKTNSMMAFVLGAAAVFAYFFIRDMFDTRVKTESDLVSAFNIPVLGSIPSFKNTSSNGTSKRG